MPSPLRQRLETDLRAAIRAGDAMRVSVLRVTLAAIANSEAVDPAEPAVRAGLRGDVARKALPEADIRGIVARERAGYLAAAGDLRRAGLPDAAAEHDRRAGILAAYLQMRR
jgi:uncharacterized protein YqeY